MLYVSYFNHAVVAVKANPYNFSRQGNFAKSAGIRTLLIHGRKFETIAVHCKR
ncbi:MAG: hypothetical protein LBF81_06655 [Prevotellaceae bacterium]|jgi:hypothetical protein|nr:hypothetical protein [Prevotellaceae bacterium]